MHARAPALAALLLGAALAGCLAAPAPAPFDPAGDVSPALWERPLAAEVATPAIAPTRSDADRRSDVAPPGAAEFAAFDLAMEQFMATHQIPAATVAVLHDGKLRYENGYGFLDQEGTQPTPPDAMLRIASITKPMTAAIVAMLVEQGLLAWDDPVFCVPPEPRAGCLLPIEPHPKRPVADPRLADLELRHLVVHRTGWTRGPCTEPTLEAIAIAHAFGIPSPPPRWRQAQWMMGTPMEFDPGTDPGESYDTYCNVGYAMLGLVAEAVTGARIEALYDAYLFRPLEVQGHIEPGRSLPEHRNSREPFYACDYGLTFNVYDPAQKVCWPDGGFDMEGNLPVGGMVATAAAVGALFEVFWNNGTVRDPAVLRLDGHTGGLPGTAATARRFSEPLGLVGDVQVVVLFNKQTGHELAPFGVQANYPYQLLHASLLGAYAAAEAKLPV